jgi:HSP20 family protein
MPGEHDKFTKFERIRREIDDLFDDVWERAGFPRRQRAGFRPRVDVYYTDDPARAVVKADLAGIDIESLNLEIRGRVLIISGERHTRDSEGRVYQQLEIEHGPFTREIQLGMDVDEERASATYENGILRIELPVSERSAQPRRVSVQEASRRRVRE